MHACAAQQGGRHRCKYNWPKLTHSKAAEAQVLNQSATAFHKERASCQLRHGVALVAWAGTVL